MNCRGSFIRFSQSLSALALILGCSLGLTIPTAASTVTCGDNNGDGLVNVGDAVHVIRYVFSDGPACIPPELGDANCDGTVNVGDAVGIINRVFRSGPEPCCECSSVGQPILFEYCYSNYAWGPRYNGFYIDNAGRMIQYNYTGDIPYSTPWFTELTEAELMERYSQNPVVVKILPPCLVKYYYSKVAAVAEGQLSSMVPTCYDAGIAYYVAYIYNADTQLYIPVLLHQMGDGSQKNFAPEAEELFFWMMSLQGFGPDDIFCSYWY